jgi:hypothetical protein
MESSLEKILLQRLKKEELVSYMNSHPNEFSDLLTIALSDKQPQAWRAAWLIYHCMHKNDVRLKKHIRKIINALRFCKDGHQREWLKVLERMELSENNMSLLFDVCFTIWHEVTKSPSVRGTAFKTLIRIAKYYPELNDELEQLAQSHYIETLSPGIKSSFIKMIDDMKINSNK